MLTASVQTFLFLGAAEAAGGFLELVTIHFDHPKWTEHLCQVGSFITAGKLGLNKSVPTEFLTDAEVETRFVAVLGHKATVCFRKLCLI